MNHDPAPEVTATRLLPRLLQRFARWRHFRAWEYGTCRDTKARRNRMSGAVQFVLWPKGYVVREGGAYDDKGRRLDFVYPSDWWHDFDSSWWPKFKKA